MITQEQMNHRANVASAATWPFAGISTALFMMRLFARWRLPKQARNFEDFMLTLAWVFAIVQAAIFQKALDSAKELDPNDMPGTVPKAAFWAIMMNNWSFLSIELPKVAVAILITHLFRPALWVRISIWILCVTINVLAVVGFIITWVMCNPVAGQWDPFTYPQAQCWPRSIQITYACVLSGISTFINIAFSVYPAIVVWRLQMPLWKKMSTIGLMGLGLVAFVFSIIKLYYMTFLLDGPGPLDLIYLCAQLGIWNRIENDFVLMVGLLPFVPPFIKSCSQFTKKHLTINSQRHKSSQYSTLASQKQDTRVNDNLELELTAHAQKPGLGDTWSDNSVGKSHRDSMGKGSGFF
ncbi:hypothetical protein NUU61_009328 [Penicillium alfredii]|uniref:Rhodopsin domain-containing protein n=1 Tax=Penicillium alfredii TaxID=1506179 RepID=A0A9W9JWT2_9EURO|nr:uncharacterized protein NUU61_009328 [Penicillium alfredii]KAJ5084749.1 hypothetical protein NUU61_009328 [Penicillium alfredii]